MKKRRRTIAIGLLLVAIAFAWVVMSNWGEPTFRGKPESYWITNIVYNGPTAQIEQWQGYGTDGARLLTGYLDRGGGWQITYRNAYRRYAGRLPQIIFKHLPSPEDNRAYRMSALSLLSSLSGRETNVARVAEPAIARALEDDNPSLRQIAVGSYESDVLRSQIVPSLKQARVKQFLRLAEDDEHWVRGNAAIALRYYPEEAPTIAPVLVKILPEPHPHIQLTIGRTLASVDREAAVQAGVAGIAADLMRYPEQRFTNQALQRWTGWEISRQAAEVLGELHAEPAISLPVLIEGLSSTNREIAIASFRALIQFKDQSGQTLPALRQAATRKDIPNWVTAELRQIEPAAANP